MVDKASWVSWQNKKNRIVQQFLFCLDRMLWDSNFPYHVTLLEVRYVVHKWGQGPLLGSSGKMPHKSWIFMPLKWIYLGIWFWRVDVYFPISRAYHKQAASSPAPGAAPAWRHFSPLLKAPLASAPLAPAAWTSCPPRAHTWHHVPVPSRPVSYG